jgi:hypothetical protein
LKIIKYFAIIYIENIKEVLIMTKLVITIYSELEINRKDYETEEEYIQAVQEGVQSLDLNAEDMTYEYYEEED